jgi:transposase
MALRVTMSRGYAAEFGLVAAKGLDKIEPLLPALAKALFATLAADYAELEARPAGLEACLQAWHRQDATSRRLLQVPVSARSAPPCWR